MRKNFLLVFLLALLPLAGWAQTKGDIEIRKVVDGEETAVTAPLEYNENGYQLVVYKFDGPGDGQWTKVGNPSWAYCETADGNFTTLATTQFKTAGYYKAHAGGANASWSDPIQILPKTTQGDDPSTPVAGDETYKEVQVKGISGVEMPWGGEIEMTEDNAINVISLVGLELNTQEDALKKAIIVKLKVNNAAQLKTFNVGTYPYSLGLKYSSEEDLAAAIEAGEESENYGTYNTVIVDGVEYKISPIDDAEVNIVKAKNELTYIDDELALQALTLTYNGDPQNLVGLPVVEDGQPAIKPATIGGVEYFMLTKAAYDALVAATENPAPANPAQYEIPEGATWSETIPQGTAVGFYYIWARAAETGNYTGSEPAYVGAAEIQAAAPIFAGTINIDEKYFRTPRRGNVQNWKRLYFEDLTKNNLNPPTGSYTVKLNKDAAAETVEKAGDVTYWLLTGLEVDGETVYGNAIEISNNRRWNNFNFETGKYRVVAAYNGNDHFGKVEYAASKVYADFEVVRPTVTIQTTPNPYMLAYGTDATFGYEATFEEGAWEATLNDPLVSYNWYSDEACEHQLYFNGDVPVGNYYVKVDGEFEVQGFDVEILPAKVTVLAGEIYANIEDQELVYGQTLPLTLTYVSGAYAPESDEIDAFEETIWGDGSLQAKNVETKEEFDLYRWSTGSGFNRTYHTTLLPVGTWEVSMEVSGVNNQLIVSKGTWTVTPKDITNEDFNNPRVAGMGGTWDLSMTYTSEQLVPGEEELEGKFTYSDQATMFNPYPYELETLVYGKDFEVINPGENINAGEGAGTFTVKGIGNYTGEKELTFDIAKAPLYVNPIAATWKIDTEEPNDTYAIDWDSETGIKQQLKKFKNDRNGKLDLTTANGFKDLAVKRIVGATAGEYAEGVKAYLPEDAAPADNYEFIFGTAPLTIEKGLLQLKMADLTTTYDGTNKPAYNFGDLELVGPENLNPILVEDDNWWNILKVDEEKADQIKKTDDLVADANGRYNAGTYTITYEIPEGTFYATNYEVEIVEPTTATLTVEPAEIEISARDYSVRFREFLDEEGKIDQDKIDAYIASITTKTVGEGDDAVTEVNDAAVRIRPRGGLKAGDAVKDVVAEIQIAGIVAGENAITVVAAENPNYTITTVDGTLTVIARRGITLFSEDDVKELNDDDEWVVTEPGDMTTLNTYNNQPVQWVNVYIKQPSVKKNGEETPIAWNADQWYSLVFPFDVTVREVSNAFGYAIVNIADPDATTEKNVMFKLQKITDVIPANTPFCLKTDEDIDTSGEGYLLEFDGVRYIQLPEGGKPSVLIEDPASLGYTFDGTYETMTIDNSLSYLRFLYNDGWKYVGKTSSTAFTLKPYTGYVNLGESNAARNVTFTFEEADGTTTSIDAVDFMSGKTNVDAEGVYNLNGIKLQGAPTQKGVYIQKGQKVIVK